MARGVTVARLAKRVDELKMAPLRSGVDRSDEVLAGHAFRLQHEVRSIGRGRRLVARRGETAESLSGRAERGRGRPDDTGLGSMQPRRRAPTLIVDDFAPDVRSGPRPQLCARPGAHRHEQEIADRSPFCPRADHPADCELTLQLDPSPERPADRILRRINRLRSFSN